MNALRNVRIVLTVHLNKAQFQHAALKCLKTTDIERSLAELDLDDGFGEVRHRPRLVTNTTPGPCTRFLPSLTPEDLTAYLIAISQYIEAHSPMHKQAFKTLRDWIFNRDMGLFNALGIRAPDDPKPKAINHRSALGGLFFARYLVLRRPRSLEAVEKCLQDYCDAQPALTRSEATANLLSSLGFVQTGYAGFGPTGFTAPLSTIPSTLAQALADRAIADALKLAWIDINVTSKPCLNCHAVAVVCHGPVELCAPFSPASSCTVSLCPCGHSAGACWKERRAELPCRICLGMGAGALHSELNCPGPAANNLADWARISVILWKHCTGHPLFSGPSRHQGGDGGNGTN